MGWGEERKILSDFFFLFLFLAPPHKKLSRQAFEQQQRRARERERERERERARARERERREREKGKNGIDLLSVCFAKEKIPKNSTATGLYFFPLFILFFFLSPSFLHLSFFPPLS